VLISESATARQHPQLLTEPLALSQIDSARL
jgi:hypothetical protein